MIDKQTFVKTITKLRKHMERISKIEDSLGVVFDFGMLDDVVVELLEEMFGLDTNDIYGSTLSWWVFELEFGAKWKPDSLTVDGETIDLSTAEKLYDYLTA